METAATGIKLERAAKTGVVHVAGVAQGDIIVIAREKFTRTVAGAVVDKDIEHLVGGTVLPCPKFLQVAVVSQVRTQYHTAGKRPLRTCGEVKIHQVAAGTGVAQFGLHAGAVIHLDAG